MMVAIVVAMVVVVGVRWVVVIVAC